MKEALSFAERNALKGCEATIERGLETFSAVGTALLKIRDQRLYRAKHKNFEEYCKERWGMSRAHAYRQMEAADVVKNLSPMGDTHLSPIGDKTESPVLIPEHERQTRELAPLPAEEQRAAWKEAVEESHGEQPTAQAVAKAARRHAPCHVPRGKPAGRAAEESPLGRQLHRRHDVSTEHQHDLTAILISIEELAQPKIDLVAISRELMMADGRRYEAQVRQAHQTLGCLLDAMRRIA